MVKLKVRCYMKQIRIVPEWNVNINRLYQSVSPLSIRIVPEWNVNPNINEYTYLFIL